MTRTPLVITMGVALVLSTGCNSQQAGQAGATPGAPATSTSSSGSGLGAVFGTFAQVALGLMSSGGNTGSAIGPSGAVGTSGSSSGGIGMVDAITRILGALAGQGTAAPSSQPSFLGMTGGTGTPSGWQQAVGPVPSQSSSGGGALADPATTNVVPTGGVYRVVATSFWNQDVAGTTIEDGDNRLDEGERGMSLPSRRGLGRWVAIRYNGRVAYAPVIDVGPIYTDDAYWEGDGIPRAVRNAGQQRTGPTNEVGGVMQRTTFTVNGQAADLTPATWRDLGVNTRQVKDTIEWWFVDEGTGLAGFRQQQAGQALVA